MCVCFLCWDSCHRLLRSPCNRDDPEANPGRPTVSTPATLTPVGYLQFETGFLGAGDSPEFSSRYGFNEVMKLSVAPRLELIASGEPIAHYTEDGKTGNSVADVFLGGQGRSDTPRGPGTYGRSELFPSRV